jgi:hypothetical protein
MARDRGWTQRTGYRRRADLRAALAERQRVSGLESGELAAREYSVGTKVSPGRRASPGRYKELQPWAESLLVSIVQPSGWLCNVAIQTYSPDISRSLDEYVWSETFGSVEQAERDDKHLGSLYLRFERRDCRGRRFWSCQDNTPTTPTVPGNVRSSTAS